MKTSANMWPPEKLPGKRKCRLSWWKGTASFLCYRFFLAQNLTIVCIYSKSYKLVINSKYYTYSIYFLYVVYGISILFNIFIFYINNYK